MLIYTAAQPDRRCTCDEIATAFDVSRHHLVKVVHELQRLGYLHTHRGRTGGFTLARAPSDIVIGDVVRRTEETLAVVECFDREFNTCPIARACGLKGALREALQAFLSVLDRYTLADFVAQPQWLARVVALTPKPGAARA